MSIEVSSHYFFLNVFVSDLKENVNRRNRLRSFQLILKIKELIKELISITRANTYVIFLISIKIQFCNKLERIKSMIT